MPGSGIFRVVQVTGLASVPDLLQADQLQYRELVQEFQWVLLAQDYQALSLSEIAAPLLMEKAGVVFDSMALADGPD